MVFRYESPTDPPLQALTLAPLAFLQDARGITRRRSGPGRPRTLRSGHEALVSLCAEWTVRRRAKSDSPCLPNRATGTWRRCAGTRTTFGAGVLSNKASEQSGAQVQCVAALPNGRVVSGSGDRTLMVWGASSGECLGTLRGHARYARHRRPVDTTRRTLVDAVRGAGQLRRRPAERRRRVWVGRPHAQGLGRVERSVPPEAERAHELSAAPASSRTARRSLVDAATGAGRVRRRPVERPRRVWVERRHAQGVGPVDRRLPRDAERALRFRAAPASSRTARLIARRRREGRRSGASPRCRTAASCPDRRTAD